MRYAQNKKIHATAIGIAAINAIGPYWAAPLHPSVKQDTNYRYASLWI